MKPVVDGLQKQYSGRVDFVVYADLNADAEAGAFASRQGVSAVPTTMLVAPDGSELHRWVGAKAPFELQRVIDSALQAP